MIKKEKNGVVWYEFEHLAPYKDIRHCFTTRIGGVSKAPYNDMNLAYHMGDDAAVVKKNYDIIAKAVRFDPQQIMMTNQVHQDGVQIIEAGDAVFAGVDSLITEDAGPVLTTYYADCVPLLFFDPVNKVVANAHAGWRGTSMNIGGKVFEKMVQWFECDPKNILIGIGPAISQEHFEVGPEVVALFQEQFNDLGELLHVKDNGKGQINLPELNKQLLLAAGAKTENIEVANLCTYSYPELFFSHRRDGAARGNMVAMISLT